MSDAKELWLFTIRFPFGGGEAFLESELAVLARTFERVRIFPLMSDGTARAIPMNVEVINLFGADMSKPLPLVGVLADLRRFRHVMRVCRASAPSAAVFAKHRRELMSKVRQAMYRESVLEARMAAGYDPERVVLFSYWASDWATVLGLWKLADDRVRFVTRMMGFDMYDHRAPDNWQMFQAFHVQQVDRVFTIAKAGLEHMVARFPLAKEKFAISHLATSDHGVGPWEPSGTLRIVSCAHLIPLKRVHLLAEALRHVAVPVEWTHFGGGTELQRIRSIVAELPAHVVVELVGQRPNADIIAWYERHPVDLFVHTSETEGGPPVALQEAASFGIPLFGADAGGVGEVVNGTTGELLPHDITADQLRQRLEAFAARTDRAEMRSRVREFWSQHFNAEHVHGKFARELLTR